MDAEILALAQDVTDAHRQFAGALVIKLQNEPLTETEQRAYQLAVRQRAEWALLLGPSQGPPQIREHREHSAEPF